MLTVRLKKLYWNMFGVVVRFHWSFPLIMFFHLICDFCKISLRGIFQTAERVSIRVLITRSFSVLSRAISLFEDLATLTRVYRSLHAVCSRTPITQPFENGKRYEENLVKISKNKTIESEAFSKSERERAEDNERTKYTDCLSFFKFDYHRENLFSISKFPIFPFHYPFFAELYDISGHMKSTNTLNTHTLIHKWIWQQIWY